MWRRPPGSFTIDFCAESKVYALLREHYGVPDDLALMERLHVDFRYPKPNWIGFPLADEQGRPTDYFGIPRAGAGDFEKTGNFIQPHRGALNDKLVSFFCAEHGKTNFVFRVPVGICGESPSDRPKNKPVPLMRNDFPMR